MKTVKGNNELTDLPNEINRMLKMLEQANIKLKEYAENLEVLAEERSEQLKEANEQLVRSERLAAIGQAAAMIGHDLRNPLTVMANAVYYLKLRLGSEMDNIWTPFFTTESKGVGLGLGLPFRLTYTICKRIVEAPAAKITVDSAPNKGLTFTVILPAMFPAETESEG